MKEKFSLGQVAATPAALKALEASGQDADFFFDMHAMGDWGDGDEATNDLALLTGEPLISAYKTLKGAKLLVVSDPVVDGQRKMTVCVLPAEYGEDEQ